MKCSTPLLLLCLLGLAACGNSPLPGGSEIAHGVYWRLNVLGEGERNPTDSDSVFVRVRMARPQGEPGSIFSTERWYAMGTARGASAFFARMRRGDSATVMMPSRQMPWAALGASKPEAAGDTGWVRMELSLIGIRSLEDSKELAWARLKARTQADEERIQADFLLKDSLPWKQAMGVWYILDPMADKGPRVQSGQMVTLAYTASFLDNGQVFDEQATKDGGLTFRLGDPGQVIKGLEAAAHLLPEQGGSGRFVIPSALAFGPTGSSSGIVPPWTPVLYRVTVLPQPEEARAAQ